MLSYKAVVCVFDVYWCLELRKYQRGRAYGDHDMDELNISNILTVVPTRPLMGGYPQLNFSSVLLALAAMGTLKLSGMAHGCIISTLKKVIIYTVQ